MKRTLDIETPPTALRVLAHEATRIALEAPPTEPAAHTLTPLAGLLMSWSELDEWLEAS